MQEKYEYKARRTSRTKASFQREALCLLSWFVFCAVGIMLARETAPWLIDFLLVGKRYVIATGYCNCEKCCGWELNENGQPVYNYGRLKGKHKIIGQTSSGTIARHGTIAADPRVFKMGTRLKVPGYGIGVVEDVGGAIKGSHIDLWFSTHEEAKKWGRKKICITKM